MSREHLRKLVNWCVAIAKLLLGPESEWRWVGQNGLLCRRDSTYGRFDVVEIIESHYGSGRGRFATTWRPGAIPLPERWQERLGEDLQWYVPPSVACNLIQVMEEDAEIYVGMATIYRITVQVFDAGMLVAQDADTLVNVRVRPDVMDPVVDERASELLAGLTQSLGGMPLAA